MNQLSKKFLVSTIIIITFLVTTISGVMLLFDLDRSLHELAKQIHIVFSLFFTVLIIIHLYFNFKIYIGEGRNFFK